MIVDFFYFSFYFFGFCFIYLKAVILYIYVCGSMYSFLWFLFFPLLLIYSVLPISTVQQSDPVIDTVSLCILIKITFPFIEMYLFIYRNMLYLEVYWAGMDIITEASLCLCIYFLFMYIFFYSIIYNLYLSLYWNWAY